MKANEAEMLIRYAMMLYPSFKQTEQQISKTSIAWANEFCDEPKEVVAEAFRFARLDSPDWMPSVPQIQTAINTIKTALKVKSKEQEFKDSHCGKSQSEWEDYNNWKKSETGKEKLDMFKARLKAIVTGDES